MTKYKEAMADFQRLWAEKAAAHKRRKALEEKTEEWWDAMAREHEADKAVKAASKRMERLKPKNKA